MGLIGKVFAFIMLPLSIIVFLDAIGLYRLDLPFDKMFLASLLMIGLQVATVLFVVATHKSMKLMDGVTLIAFSAPGAAYIAMNSMGMAIPSYLPIVLSVIMFVESVYALH